MPKTAETIFNIFIFIPLGIALAIAVRHLVKGKGPILLYCIIGGAFAATMEPIVDVLGLVYLKEQERARHVHGARPHDAALHLLRLPVVRRRARLPRLQAVRARHHDDGPVPAVGARLRGRHLPRDARASWPAPTCYYGHQPFNIWGFPLWWGFVNPVMPMVAGALIYKIRPHLKTNRGSCSPLIPLHPDGRRPRQRRDGVADVGRAQPDRRVLRVDLPGVLRRRSGSRSTRCGSSGSVVARPSRGARRTRRCSRSSRRLVGVADRRSCAAPSARPRRPPEETAMPTRHASRPRPTCSLPAAGSRRAVGSAHDPHALLRVLDPRGARSARSSTSATSRRSRSARAASCDLPGHRQRQRHSTSTILDYEMTMPWPRDRRQHDHDRQRAADRVRRARPRRARITLRQRRRADRRSTSPRPRSPRCSPAATSCPARRTTTTTRRASPAAASSSCTAPATLVLDGERYDVDCYAPRDRSWRQVRKETRGGGAGPAGRLVADVLRRRPDLQPDQLRGAGHRPGVERRLRRARRTARRTTSRGCSTGDETKQITRVRRNVLEYHPQTLRGAAPGDRGRGRGRRGSTASRGEAIATARAPGVAERRPSTTASTAGRTSRAGSTHSTYQEVWFDRYQRADEGARPAARTV